MDPLNQELSELVEAAVERALQKHGVVAGPQSSPDRMLNKREVAEMCGFSVSTLYRLADQGKFPRSTKIVGHNVWRESVVRAWIDARIAEGRGRGQSDAT